MNPLKQGLKQELKLTEKGFNEDVKEVNPLKQGLKLLPCSGIIVKNSLVKEVNPLKQGLNYNIIDYFLISTYG